MPGMFKRTVSAVMAAVLSLSAFLNVHFLTANAASTVLFLAATSLHHRQAFAQATPEAAAALGNSVGNLERGNVRLPSVAPSGDMTLHSTNPAVEGNGLTINQLFSSGANSASNNSALSAGAGTYGDMTSMSAQSSTQVTTLMDASNTSPWSNAYKTLRESKVNNPSQTTDLRGDPSITASSAIAHSTDSSNFLNGLDGGCTTVVTSTDNTKTFHIAEMHTCDRYVGAPFCKVERAAIGDPITDVVALTFTGSVSDILSIDLQFVNATGGTLIGYGNETTLNSAFVPYDLVLMNSLGSADMSLTVNALTYAQAAAFTNPVEVTYTVTGLAPSGSVLITQPTAGNGYRLSALVNGGSEWPKTVSLTIKYSTSTVQQVAIQEDPPNCVANPKCSANPTSWVSSGTGLDLASTNVWQCTEGYTNLVTGGLVLTPIGAQALPGIFPGQPTGPGIPACFKAQARDYQCTVPLGSDISTCGDLETNGSCVLVTSECMPQNRDLSTGQCLLQTETWDCGANTTTSEIGTGRTTICAGPIRCMGTSCIEEPPAEKNKDFNQVAAQLNIAEYANFDKDCTSGSGQCEVFKGTPGTCSVVFGGIVNCCDAPSGPSLASYIKLGYYTMKIADRTGALKYVDGLTGDAITGYWNEARNFATATYDKAIDSVVSLYESTATKTASSGAANALESASGTMFATMKSEMMTSLVDWVTGTFGPDVALNMFTLNASMEYELNAAVSEALELISDVFMYYTIALVAIEIIYACKPEEIELSVKKAMKQCHYLGRYCGRSFLGICFYRVDSYCCFKSPLARILNEQIRLYSGLGWAPASEHPICPGLTTTQLAAADWSKIDLSEWTDLLTYADLRPRNATQADDMYSADNVTRFKGPDSITGTGTSDNAKTALNITTPSNATQSVRAQLWATLP